MVSGYCVKCGTWRRSLHRDHVIPRFEGGSDDLANIQLLCGNCHEDKTAEDLKRFRHSPESRAKMKDSALKRTSDPAVRAEIGARTKISMADPKVKKNLGEANQRNKARVTPRGVIVIRQMRAAGMTQQAIADYLSLSRQVVRSICEGKTFTWVP